MRWYLLLLAPLLYGGVLTSTKEKEIQLERQKAQVQASKLETSWIDPIRLSYLYQKGDQFPNQLLENFTISIDQPIFKSLGIWEAIRYARAKRGESLQGVELKRKELIASVYKLAFTIKRLQLQYRKNIYALDNAKIDVEVKKESYKSGELDGTFLNDAILKKNTIALTLLDLRQRIEESKRKLHDLSDLSVDRIKLPTLKLLPLDRFVRDNLALHQAKSAQRSAKHFKNMTISRYLPSISLFVHYNYQKSQGSLYAPGFSYMDHFYTYGLKVAMPLDINAYKEIESAKVDYLRSLNKRLDLLRQKRDLYREILKKLQILDRKIALTKEDIDLYKELLEDTKKRYEAGEKTIYDLQTMKNSLEQKRVDLEIFAIDKQLLLLELYKEVSDEI